MSYTSKTNWKTNDIVMETDFNRIEQGIDDLYTGEYIDDVSEITSAQQTDIIPIFRNVSNSIVRYKTKISSLISLLKQTFAITDTHTATIPTTDWTTWAIDKNEVYYKKSITVTGLLDSDNPIVDVRLINTSPAYAQQVLDSWSNIYRVYTRDNEIIFEAFKIPEIAIPIQIKVVR